MDNFFDLFNEVNLQNIDNVVINPDEQINVNNLYKSYTKILSTKYVKQVRVQFLLLEDTIIRKEGEVLVEDQEEIIEKVKL